MANTQRATKSRTRTDDSISYDDVGIMRKVGERCERAEKISWTTGYMLERRPRDEHVRDALLEELHDYLADTATIVRELKKRQALASVVE